MSPSAVHFAITGLWRTRFRSSFLFVGQSFLLASIVSAILLNAFSLSLTGLEGTYGLAGLLQRYSSLVTLFSLFVCAVSAYSSSRLLLAFRRKDINLTVGLGGNPSRVHFLFIFELLLFQGFSLVLGNLLGFGFYYVIQQLFWGLGYKTTIPLPFFPLILLNGGYFIVAYIVGAWVLTRATTRSYDQLLQSEFLRPGKHILEVFFPLPRSVPRKLALRSLSRSTLGVGTYSVFVFFTILLLCFLTVGNGVVKDTTISYVDKGMGTDVWAIGHPDFVYTVVDSFQLFHDHLPSFSHDPLNGSFAIPSSLVTQLSNYGLADIRLLLISEIKEIHLEFENESGFTSRRPRSTATWVVGIDPTSTVSSWEYESGGVSATALNRSTVLIGEWLANNLFSYPLIQAARLYNPFNSSFSWKLDVAGILYDPFAGGRTCYVDRSLLASQLSLPSVWISRGNLLFFRPYNSSSLAQALHALQDHGFTAVSLSSFRERVQLTLFSIWGVFLFASFPLIVGLTGFTVTYFIGVVDHRREEIWLLRALGGSNLVIFRSFLFEILLIWLFPSFPSLILGSSVALVFLIPHPLINDPLLFPLLFSELFFLICLNLLFLWLVVKHRLRNLENWYSTALW